MSLRPEISGTLAIRSAAGPFAEALQRRVAAGLLTGRRDSRSNYRIVSMAGADGFQISAADWPTALSIGLNDVTLHVAPGSVQYQIRYWRWAAYVLILSGIFLVAGIAALLFLDVRGYIAHSTTSAIPGLSLDQNLLVLWGIVLFWGVAWPWVMIAIHKRPLRRLIARLIGEIDSDALAR